MATRSEEERQAMTKRYMDWVNGMAAKIALLTAATV
jgi:hypothetical protein